jgi:CheY-like chemotaxis protein
MAAWKGRILVVEDSELNAILIRLLAEQLGWKCDWSESIERLEKELNSNQHTYDFILLDQHLDAQKGGKWLRAFLDSNPDYPGHFIGISAQFFEYDVQDLIRAGISGIFPKPISKENLIAIKEALDSKRVQGFSASYFKTMFGNAPLVAQSVKVFLHRLFEFKNESIAEFQKGHWNRSLGLHANDLNPDAFLSQLQQVIQQLP